MESQSFFKLSGMVRYLWASRKLGILIAVLVIIQFRCQPIAKPQYVPILPDYSLVSLVATNDTIVFKWDTARYNRIRSFNYFVDHDSAYICFYDKHSLTIYVYNFQSQENVLKIPLYKYMPKETIRRKTTVFLKNMDSLFIISYFVLYQMNGNGVLIDSLPLQLSPHLVISSFENIFPPVFRGDTIFLSADPVLKRYNKQDLSKWDVLAEMNMKKKRISFHYNIPDLYKSDNYAEDLYDNNYCYNEKERFVFSFSADTLLYESNLSSYHTSYYAKSRFQHSPILPIINVNGKKATKSEISNRLLLSDSYGPVYFDAKRRRYLRVFYKGISPESYEKREWVKEQSIIIMNEHFKIIGESTISNKMDLNSLFFTKEGKIYARVIKEELDDLYFVELELLEKKTS